MHALPRSDCRGSMRLVHENTQTSTRMHSLAGTAVRIRPMHSHAYIQISPCRSSSASIRSVHTYYTYQHACSYAHTYVHHLAAITVIVHQIHVRNRRKQKQQANSLFVHVKIPHACIGSQERKRACALLLKVRAYAHKHMPRLAGMTVRVHLYS